MYKFSICVKKNTYLPYTPKKESQIPNNQKDLALPVVSHMDFILVTIISSATLLCTHHSNKNELSFIFLFVQLIQTSLALKLERCTAATAESRCDLTQLGSTIIHKRGWDRGVMSDNVAAFRAPKCGIFIITA